MSNHELGKTPSEDAARDATHIAIVPVIAGAKMQPGDHCRVHDKNGVAVPAIKGLQENIGIVDPFLTEAVDIGERFYLCLYPGTVTGLRHHYAHPELDEIIPTNSIQWVVAWCSQNEINYLELMHHAKSWLEKGEWWSEGGRFEGTHLPEEFWGHYANITGKKVPEQSRESFFSCSC